MTPREVADHLLIHSRRLAATRVGRVYRIPREDLEAFMALHSTRDEVRARRFARLNAVAERHPGVSSDDLLKEMEREDAARRHGAAS
ncbi:MAG: helix-turn-helix domain-containing protein [Chloroflexi bacterium]|nr:helix-turn-helix domain-containing protein [Chloroflexota bacterium]